MEQMEQPGGFPKPPKISNVPNTNALALFDADGTLTKPGKQLAIQRFIEDVQVGAWNTRGELFKLFAEWAEAKEKGANPNYQHYLGQVGEAWSRLLTKGGYNPTRQELMQVTENWFEIKGKRQIMDYSPRVISEVRKRLIRPVLVTGMPYEMAYHFAKHLDIEYVFGMEVEVDSYERYIEYVKHNTGLAHAKYKVCEQLGLKGHKVLFAMGDTHADAELFRAAISLTDRQDCWGRAVLVNPDPKTMTGAMEWCAGWIASHRLIAIQPPNLQDAVVETVISQLDNALNDNHMEDGQLDMAA